MCGQFPQLLNGRELVLPEVEVLEGRQVREGGHESPQLVVPEGYLLQVG